MIGKPNVILARGRLLPVTIEYYNGDNIDDDLMIMQVTDEPEPRVRVTYPGWQTSEGPYDYAADWYSLKWLDGSGSSLRWKMLPLGEYDYSRRMRYKAIVFHRITQISLDNRVITNESELMVSLRDGRSFARRAPEISDARAEAIRQSYIDDIDRRVEASRARARYDNGSFLAELLDGLFAHHPR